MRKNNPKNEKLKPTSKAFVKKSISRVASGEIQNESCKLYKGNLKCLLSIPEKTL